MALVLSACSLSRSDGSDWGSPIPKGFTYGRCTTIARSLLLPVPPERRQQAIAMLDQHQTVVLDKKTATELVGDEHSSATTIIRNEIPRLESKREAALKRRSGSWSSADEVELDALVKLSGDEQMLKPVLSRALTINEGTGGFRADVCGDNLIVAHVSLGAAGSSANRVPVLLFLRQAPAKVYLSVALAE